MSPNSGRIGNSNLVTEEIGDGRQLKRVPNALQDFRVRATRVFCTAFVPRQIEPLMVPFGGDWITVDNADSTAKSFKGGMLPHQCQNIHIPFRMMVLKVTEHGRELDGVSQTVAECDQNVLSCDILRRGAT